MSKWLKCEKCGIEYPETDFHQGGAGGPLICIRCHQSSSRSQGGEGVASDASVGGDSDPPLTAVRESVGEGVETGARFSNVGLIVAAVFVILGDRQVGHDRHVCAVVPGCHADGCWRWRSGLTQTRPIGRL